MPEVTFKVNGNFKSTEGYLKRLVSTNYTRLLHQAGRDGVQALVSATPVESGATASSWFYTLTKTRGGYKLEWHNSNTTVSGTPIAILLQVGHATGTGGYVQGKDYINPALKPVIKRLNIAIANEVRR